MSLLGRAVVTAMALTMGVAVLGLSDAHAQQEPQYTIRVASQPFTGVPLGGTGITGTPSTIKHTNVASAASSTLVEEHKDMAVNGQFADVGSTGIGLAMGAAEANPLGLVTLGVKAAMYQRIKEAPPTEQPRMWGVYGAFGWGAAANNLCVIAAIATGGAAAALCPVLGVATGMTVWNSNEEERNRATFDAICKELQASNPELVCVPAPLKSASALPAPNQTETPQTNTNLVQGASLYGEAGG